MYFAYNKHFILFHSLGLFAELSQRRQSTEGLDPAIFPLNSNRGRQPCSWLRIQLWKKLKFLMRRLQDILMVIKKEIHGKANRGSFQSILYM